jgi:hypothetical protein
LRHNGLVEIWTDRAAPGGADRQVEIGAATRITETGGMRAYGAGRGNLPPNRADSSR